MIFVSSWDDGHPLDERVAGLLDKHGLRGTFYVPIRNREGLPVMEMTVARRLHEQFEVGSHTLDHVYLRNLDENEMKRQLEQGKEALEVALGSQVDSFCYPGGQVNAAIRRAVEGTGFRSARTIENLRLDAGTDRYMIPTTLQFYPHRCSALLRNFVRRGHYIRRAPALIQLCSKRGWFESIGRFLNKSASTNAVFHLWGHSWEIEERGLWAELESFLAAVASTSLRTYTVSELAAASFSSGDA